MGANSAATSREVRVVNSCTLSVGPGGLQIHALPRLPLASGSHIRDADHDDRVGKFLHAEPGVRRRSVVVRKYYVKMRLR